MRPPFNKPNVSLLSDVYCNNKTINKSINTEAGGICREKEAKSEIHCTVL